MASRPSETKSFERVGGPGGPFFLGDGQHLVGQVGLAQVVERLAGHGRVGHRGLGGHEGQGGVGQRRLAGRGRRLEHGPQGPIAQARGEGEPGHQGAVTLTDHPQGAKRRGHLVDQIGGFEQRQGPFALGAGDLGHRCLLVGHRGGLGALGGQQHPAQLGGQLLVLGAQLGRRRVSESRSGPGRVEVEGVDVEPLAASHHDVHLEGPGGGGLGDVAHPPGARSHLEHQLVVGQRRGAQVRGWRHRGGRGHGLTRGLDAGSSAGRGG